MALNIDKNKVEHLVKKLQEFKNSGLSMEDGIRNAHIETGAMGNQANNAKFRSANNIVSHNSGELALATITMYSSITALKIATLTKELFGTPEAVVEAVLGAFPNYTAAEMGKLLLNVELYPKMTFDEMKQALSAGNYSETDITNTLNSIYGSSAKTINVNFSQPTIKAINANFQTGPSTMFNSYYKNSWIMHAPGRSFIQVDYKHTRNGFSTVNLAMLHLTSMTGGRNGYSPIDIIINGKTFKSKYNVVNGNYQRDTFNITKFVNEGNNTIRLNFCNGSTTNYWINELKVDYVK